MIKLKINNINIEVPPGTTVMKAAAELGIEIPAMCYLEGPGHFPSCLICMVRDENSGRLIPSCNTKVLEGMNIDTEHEEVVESRKTSLELLLSDHVGECEAPCQTNCPAHMDIPLMNRLLAKGQFEEALKVVKKDIALPAVLGRICPAPCERACRRRSVDEAVSICLLKRYAADHDSDNRIWYVPEKAPSNGLKIAIIGTGPAGLSAAYYLTLNGYKCILFDKNSLPGGALRYAIPNSKLPKDVLDQEIETIKQLGADFIMDHQMNADAIGILRKNHDGVIIATGEDNATFEGLEKKGPAFAVERDTYRTNVEGVFAIGSAIKPGRVAIRACAHGKEVAIAIHQYLSGKPVTGEYRMFNSRFGKLMENEFIQYLMEADEGPRIEKEAPKGFSSAEVMKEAARCMHCDCRKLADCKLRIYADAYKAAQSRYFPKERKSIRKVFKNDPVVYEPEKCIKCGICVRITSLHKESLGLTFIGKGFDVEVGVPFDSETENALKKTATLCAEKCPTGALALKYKRDE